MSEPKNQIKSKKIFILQIVIPILLIALILVCSYLYLSKPFKPEPRMEIFADNTYSETLHVVTDNDYAPFSYIDKNGAYAGLDVELISEIANRLHMNLELELIDWNDANEMIQNGEADIIMNLETDLVTPDSGLIATVPTTEKQYVVYGRDTVDSVIDLYGKRVVSLHQLPALGIDITYISSYQRIFEGLQSGEFDYAICPIQVGNSFLDKVDMKHIQSSYAVSHVYGALALPADKAELRDRLNGVLKDLYDEGFLDSLDQKWVSQRYSYMNVSAIIQDNPGFATALLFILLLVVVLAFLYIMAQRRSAAIKDSYTKQLQDNLEVIRSARIKAYMDELTGVRNKNAYQEMADTIQMEIDHKTNDPFAVVVFDVNGLKQVNDIQGHKAGDQFIRDACKIICQVYAHSPVFRIGGDEFVAVLKGQDYENRFDLLKQTNDMSLKNQQSGGVVIAAGMSEFRNDQKAAAVFERADKAMYQNKAALKGARP